MVIMGDGVHNLAGGLAIGVAFASGFMSGVSTSAAVLSDELTHEIGEGGGGDGVQWHTLSFTGDFAMEIKAGMTIN
jgi:hypothetical protein